MKHKKALSLLLVFALTLTSIPASIFADTAPSDSAPIESVVENAQEPNLDPEALAAPASAGGVTQPGDSGKTADASVLRIENGTLLGFVEDYEHDGTAIVVPEGVTEIAPHAFEGIAIDQVTLPSSVKTIGSRAFYATGIRAINLENVVELRENALSKNKLSGTADLLNVKVMEAYALADNDIEIVNLGAQLTMIGDFALADNEITAVNTLNSITELGGGAFQNNKLSGEIGLPKVEKIGESAFEGNTIVSARINDDLKEIGENVFARNGRYVVVTTKSPVVKNEEYSEGFGCVLAGSYLEKVTVHFTGYAVKEENGKKVPDKTTGKTISPSIVINSDLTKQDGVIYYGVARTYVPKAISGYQPLQKSISYTPTAADGANYPLTVEYMADVDQPTVRVNGSVNFAFEETFTQEELLSRIKEAIEAKDKDNRDLLDSVKIESFSLPMDPATNRYTATPKGVEEVVVSVMDQEGRIATAKVSVFIGDDFGETIIGGKEGDEWKVKHFIYSEDGSQVLGFSDLGKTKVTTDPDVYLPGISIQGKIVTDIGEDFHFDPEEDPMSEEISIEDPTDPDHNFADKGIRSIVIPNTIRRIGQGMFQENQIRSLEIPGSVEWIDNTAFADNPIEGDLVIPDSVRVIGHMAFAGAQSTTLTVGSGAEYIGSYAFYGSDSLTDLHLKSNLKKVFSSAFMYLSNARNIDIDGSIEQIGPNAFLYLSHNIVENGGIVSNNFDFNPGIKKIGKSAFAYSGIREILLPDDVEDIDENAFLYTPFIKIELGKNLRHIGKSAFFQESSTSPILESLTFRNPEPSELTPENELIIDSEAFSFRGELDEIVFPDNLVTLESRAFSALEASTGVRKVVLPANMRRVGDYAFSRFPVKESVVFDKPAPGQTTNNELTIGEFAFADMIFGGFPITEIVLPENLIRIERRAFEGSRPSELILPEKLQVIGEMAFFRAAEAGNIGALVVPASVKSIGGSAFIRQGITALTLNEGLETIEAYAFANNSISSGITFPSTLKTIEPYAFLSNQIPSIELKEGLGKIGRSAFEGNQLTAATLPSTVTDIEDFAFLVNPGNGYKPYENNGQVYSHVELTSTEGNPNHLPGEQERSYVINPRRVILHYVDTAGQALREDEILDFAGLSEYTTDPGLLVNHTPPKQETVPLTQKETKITLTYTPWDNTKEQDVQRVTNAIGLMHIGNNTSGNIGSALRTTLKFNMQGYDDIANYKDLQIRILLPDSVDPDAIVIPPSNLITNQEVQNGQLILSLADIASTSQLELPIQWKLKSYETPEDTPQPLNTVLVSNGNILAQAAPVFLEGSYPDPKLYKYVADLTGEKKINNLVPVGDGYAKKDDNTVTYSFRVVIDRNLSHVKLIDTLPSYTNKEGQVVKMGFDASKNPEWKLKGDQLIYEADIDNFRSPSIPNLVLNALGALLDKTISNTASVELTPYRQGAGETIQKATSSEEFSYHFVKRYLKFEKYAENANGSTDDRYIYDIQKARDEGLFWRLSATADKLIKDIRIVEHDLDPRLYYSGISLSSTTLGDITINYVAKNAAGDVLKEGTLGRTPDTFEESIAKEIASIEFTATNLHSDTTDYDSSDTVGVNVFTKFRDPGSSIKNGKKITNVSDFRMELWENSSLRTGNTFTGTIMEDVAVEDVENRFYPRKTSNAGETVFTNTEFTYTLGYSSVSRRESAPVLLLEDLKNIQLVDVLPKGVMLKKVTLDPDFVKLEDANYTIEENYKGTGQTAVIFTAKSSDRYQMSVAALDVYVEPNFDTTVIQDNLVNKAYLKFDETSTNKIRNKDADGFSMTSVSDTVVKAKELVARKYIVKDGQSTDTGIYTTNDEDFSYQIKAYNALDNDFGYLEIIDVLPIVGDKSFYTPNTTQVARGSEFSNIITSVDVPAGFTAYYLNQDEAVDYSQSLRELSKNGKWETTRKSNVKAIKFVSTAKDFSFGSNGVYTFTVHAKAPQDSSLTNKKAYNSFLLLASKDAAAAANGNYMESNRVYNQFSLNPFNILLKKVSVTQEDAAKGDYSKAQPLEGAEFRLYRIDKAVDGTESLTPVASAKSDAKGDVKFTSIPASADYEVREVAAAGYQVPSKGIRIQLADIQGANYPNYNLGQFLNLPNPQNPSHNAGKLQFTKVDGDGKPLADIGFRLVKTNAETRTLNATSGANGLVQFTIVPTKVYEDSQYYDSIPGKVYPEFVTEKVLDEAASSYAVQKALSNSVRIPEADYKALPTGEFTQTLKVNQTIQTVTYKTRIVQKSYKLDYGAWRLEETTKPYLYKGVEPIVINALTEDDFKNGPLVRDNVVNDKIRLKLTELLLSGTQADEFIGVQEASGKITSPATKPLTQMASNNGTVLTATSTPDPVTGEAVENTAKFNLYKKDGTLVLENITTTKEPSVNMDIPTSLLGEDLYLEQIQEPGSTFRNPAHLEFRINGSNITDWNGNVYSNVYDTLFFPNARKSVETEITVHKTGKDALASSAAPTVLAGAEFTLYKKDNIQKDAAGKELSFEWVKVESKITDEQGEARFPIVSGEFKVEETKAPEGYLLDPTPYYFTKARYNVLKQSTVNSLNYKLRIAGVDVESFLENGTRDEEDTVRQIQPALGIIETVDGRILGRTLPKGIVEVTVDGKSQGQFTSDRYGRYDFSKLELNHDSKITIRQLQAPDGYLLNDREIAMDLSQYVEAARETQGILTVPVRNNKSYGSVTIAKYENPLGQRLAGAEFTLYNGKDEAVGTPQTTNKMGIVSWSDLDLTDSYYVKETRAPKGYKLRSEKIPVVFATNSFFVSTVYDQVFDVVVSVKTPDTTDEHGRTVPGTPVSNTVVTIKDGDGRVIGKFPVDEKGQTHIPNLDPFGNYTLEQTTPNKDYVPITEPIPFVPTDLNTFADGNYDLPFVNRPRVSLVVTGKDQDTGALLPGTKVRLVDNDGNIVEEKTTDENGRLVFQYLDGQKTYKIVLTKNPDGYYQNPILVEQEVDFSTMQKDENGDFTKEFVFRPYGSLKVDVKDKSNGKNVKGSVIVLTDEEGNLIEQKAIQGAEDFVIFERLQREKTYFIYESFVPSGYFEDPQVGRVRILLDEMQADPEGTFSYTFFVTKKQVPASPKTGDVRGMISMTALFVVAIVFLVGSLKKRKQNP